MSNNNLQIIGESVFKHMNKTLRIIEITSNKIKRFPFDYMSSFTEITNLNLNDNELAWMVNLVSNTLNVIDLSNNFGLYFSKEEFFGAPNLKVIKLHNIALQHVSPNLFISQKIASSVDLSNNNIETLESDSFHFEGSTLKFLNLKFNQIYSLDPETFNGKYKFLFLFKKKLLYF